VSEPEGELVRAAPPVEAAVSVAAATMATDPIIVNKRRLIFICPPSSFIS
jgi:hypothetical protein